jgi:carboxypeptidase Q
MTVLLFGIATIILGTADVLLWAQGQPPARLSAGATPSSQSVLTVIPDSQTVVQQYSRHAADIIKAARSDSSMYKRLQYLCDTFGSRLSGTPALERALDWILSELTHDGFENVRGEEVMVPHWQRGAESCELLEPRRAELAMLGLGGSISTPPEGITAEVIVVKTFSELTQRAAEAKGKIVLFNAPFAGYGATVTYRRDGAVRAAEVGAVASLIRSVGSYSMRTPHTGSMRYQDGVPKIPHAALSSEDADMIARMAERGQKPIVRLMMQARMHPDALSRNVIAELRGSEKPDEIVVFGGHSDSWDVGSGAMDDAGGCFAAWRALQVLKTLGLRPKRTLRLVMWTNEENGLRGGEDYAKRHGAEKHILALESDSGVFAPQGFGYSGPPALLPALRGITSLLQPIGAHRLTIGGGGADISPLIPYGVPQMGLHVDGSKYFWFHHTHADMPDKLDPDELNRCAAAIALMVFVVADMP